MAATVVMETGIAQTVPAALSNQQTLTVFSHIAHGFTSTLVDYTRTYRHFNRHVFTALTGTIAYHSGAKSGCGTNGQRKELRCCRYSRTD